MRGDIRRAGNDRAPKNQVGGNLRVHLVWRIARRKPKRNELETASFDSKPGGCREAISSKGALAATVRLGAGQSFSSGTQEPKARCFMVAATVCAIYGAST